MCRSTELSGRRLAQVQSLVCGGTANNSRRQALARLRLMDISLGEAFVGISPTHISVAEIVNRLSPTNLSVAEIVNRLSPTNLSVAEIVNRLRPTHLSVAEIVNRLRLSFLIPDEFRVAFSIDASPAHGDERL